MNSKQVDNTDSASRVAVLFGLISVLYLLVFSFGPPDIEIFDAGQELFVGPIFSFAVFLVAFVASYRTTQRNGWHIVALTISTVATVLWSALGILMYFAYSNCPDGVC